MLWHDVVRASEPCLPANLLLRKPQVYELKIPLGVTMQAAKLLLRVQKMVNHPELL